MSGAPGTASHRRLEDEFYRVMNKFTNKQWNQFARSRNGLSLPEYQIDDIRSDYSNDAREQKYQMLSLWRRRNGRKATLEKLEELVSLFFRQFLEEERSRPPERASDDSLEYNPQADLHGTDRMRQLTYQQRPPMSGQQCPNGAQIARPSIPHESIHVNPDGLTDRTFSDSRNRGRFEGEPVSADYASHYNHNDNSMPPRATGEINYVNQAIADHGRELVRDSYHDQNALRQGRTHPKGLASTETSVASGWREDLNKASRYIPPGILNTLGNGNVRITVSGNNAIGIQTNIFVGGAKVNKSNKQYATSKEKADLCSRVITTEVKLSDPSFYDEHLIDGDSIYKITHSPKGVVLIMNNSFPRQSDHRSGSNVDVRNLESMWKNMGCKPYVREEVTAAEALQTLQRFSSSQQAYQSDFVVIVIMSHGGQEKGEDVFYGANGEPVKVKEVMDVFSNVNALRLRGIPKLFFFQFCRGTAIDKGVEGLSRQEESDETLFNSLNTTVETTSGIRNNDFSDARGIPTSRDPSMSDCMISFATQPGFRAFRNSETGSWYVNAIVNVFSQWAYNQHLLDLMTMVNQAVASKTAFNTDDQTVHEGKEMSDFRSTLKKKLYFYPGFPVVSPNDFF